MNETHESVGAAKTTRQAAHTQEPWEYTRDSFFSVKNPDHVIRNINDLVVSVRMKGGDIWDGKTKINFERIVSCVNALEGVQNPAAVKQLLSFAKVILDQIDGSKPNQMIGSIFDGREITGLREAIKEMS